MMFSVHLYISVLAFYAMFSSSVESGSVLDRSQRAECMMWAKLENKTLPLQNQGQAKCVTNQECTGFSCAGVYQNKDLTFGMRVLPCRETPGVEIYGYAPQFHTKNFSHVFTHKSQYIVPGALLNMSVIPGKLSAGLLGTELTGKIEVHLERNAENNTLVLGLSAMACINGTCPFRKLVFNHTEIPVPSCPEEPLVLNESLCNVNDLFNCGPNRMCVQTDTRKASGVCQCREGFYSDSEGNCLSRRPKGIIIHDEILPPPPFVPAEENVFEQHTTTEEPPKINGGLNTALIGGIVSAAVVGSTLLFIIIGALLVTRTRLAPRLRARITRRPYEDIIIGDSSTKRKDSSSSSSSSSLP